MKTDINKTNYIGTVCVHIYIYIEAHVFLVVSLQNHVDMMLWLLPLSIESTILRFLFRVPREPLIPLIKEYYRVP